MKSEFNKPDISSCGWEYHLPFHYQPCHDIQQQDDPLGRTENTFPVVLGK